MLEGLPNGHDGIEHGGLRHLQNGVYAVVESSNLEEDVGEVKRSDLFMPIRKEVGIIDDDGKVLSGCCTLPILTQSLDLVVWSPTLAAHRIDILW